MKTHFALLFLALPFNGFAQAEGPIVVDEYVPAPGQFVNLLPEANDTDTAASMAQKCSESLNNGEAVSLGAFGGYITFHFNHPIVNQRGAYDFRICGNATTGSSEPGIVSVSQDSNGNGQPDDEWFELAGSADADFADAVVYNYEVTYLRSPMNNIVWTDNNGHTGVIARNSFHKQEYYPLWLGETLTLAGTCLPKNGRDVLGNGSYWVLDAMRYGYVDNLPNGNADGNSFNIDWAVDSKRVPVSLTHIDFIRVHTAVNQTCGWIGETSTEVSSAEDLHLQASLDFAANVSRPHTTCQPSASFTLGGARTSKLCKGLNIIDGQMLFIK